MSDDSSFASDDDSSSDGSWEEDVTSRDLLWLCQEGMLELALQRVRSWNVDNNSNQRELLKANADGNTALHEIFMGGSNEASQLVQLLLGHLLRVEEEPRRILLARRPPSHGRTLLHWAAWGKSDPLIAEQLISAYPPALLMPDGARQGRRMPVEIAERYWPEAPITTLLQQRTTSYRQYDMRRTIHLCIHRHFCMNHHKPFEDRKQTGMAPKAFYVASVMGYALQREMVDLVLHILSFVGASSSKKNKSHRKKRKTSGCSVKKVARGKKVAR